MLTEKQGLLHTGRAVLLLGAMAGVACGSTTPGGPAKPPRVVESIYGWVDLQGGASNSLKPLEADGTLTAGIRFSVSTVGPGQRP